MDRLIQHYLRVLDIDPLGYFIRLINTSSRESLDLSKICIQQVTITSQVLNSYRFNDQIRPLLRRGEIVTIYSKDYRQLKFDIEPYIFIANDISQWLIDNSIRIEISMNKIVFDSQKICSITTNDIPLLFIEQSIHTTQLSIRKTISNSNQYARFCFPYCLSIDNSINPHIRSNSDRNEIRLKRNICYENQQNVKDFNSYARRLTTAPKTIQLTKKM